MHLLLGSKVSSLNPGGKTSVCFKLSKLYVAPDSFGNCKYTANCKKAANFLTLVVPLQGMLLNKLFFCGF